MQGQRPCPRSAERGTLLMLTKDQEGGLRGKPYQGVSPFFFTFVRVRRYVGRLSLACPAVRPHFFGACPKKRCRAAKEKRLFYPGGSTIRVSAPASVDGGHLRPTWGRGLVRVRRYVGRCVVAPTARSTPFLCSCAKKRGGAPKKRAYGCRHGGCSVPPASPTDSKPQHHSRLRQADFAWPIYPPCTNQLDAPICPVGAYAQMGEAGGPTKVMWRLQRRFSLAARHRFFGQAPKKWGRIAGQANDYLPKYRRTRTSAKYGKTPGGSFRRGI